MGAAVRLEAAEEAEGAEHPRRGPGGTPADGRAPGESGAGVRAAGQDVGRRGGAVAGSGGSAGGGAWRRSAALPEVGGGPRKGEACVQTDGQRGQGGGRDRLGDADEEVKCRPAPLVPGS